MSRGTNGEPMRLVLGTMDGRMAAVDVWVEADPNDSHRMRTQTFRSPLIGEIDYVTVTRPDGLISFLRLGGSFTVMDGDTVSFTYRIDE